MNDYTKDYQFRERKIAECAASLYSNIQKIVPKEPNEADFRHQIDLILDGFCQEMNLNPLSHMEYTLFQGRADAVFNRLVIEYKRPGVLKNPPDTATKKAIEQLKDYLVDLSKKEKHKLDRLAGVLLDGNYAIFVRFRGNDWLEEAPCEISKDTIKRILSWLTSLSSGIALTADNLNRDFSIEQLQTQNFLKSLYKAFNSTVTDSESLPAKLYEQWRLFFSEAIDYSEAFGGRKLEPLKKWVRKAGLVVRTAEEAQRFFFVLHTYFALLAKFLAWLAISRHLGGRLGAPAFGELAVLNGDELRRKLEEMESGGIFRQYGILNLLEGDFFAWYLKAWNNEIEDTLRKLLSRLDEYDPTTLTIMPEETRDLFKKLYHYILPREIRHNLGEYYTPDWLAQHVLNSADEELFKDVKIKNEIKIRRKLLGTRFLDPACGSGTFLVLIISRIKDLAFRLQVDERNLLKSILSNVVGFDINPLAVLTSRVNYLLAIADLLEHRKEIINIPVYLADSVRTPAILEDLFKQNAFEFSIAIGKFLVPYVLCRKDRFDRFCSDLEEKIKSETSPEIFVNSIPVKFNLNSSEWDGKAQKHANDLYSELLSYHKKGLNGLWARLLKNNFAPLVVGEFDYIVGNPPWINWEHLPDQYRKEIARLWGEYELFPHKGFEAILGKSKDDVSILMTYVVIDKLLKENGKLAFVITQSLFKTSGGGKGFRRLSIPKSQNNSIPLAILHVHDMISLQPFEGASNRTAVMVIQKGKQNQYPVPYILWRKFKRGRISFDSTIDEVLNATRRLEYQAEPVDPQDVTSPWLTARPGAIKAIKKILGKSDYEAHAGAYTGGANAVYWVDIVLKRLDGLVVAQNITEGAKIKVDKITETIEPDLLYPLLRGRDVQRWHAEPSAKIIITHEPGMRLNAIPEKEMQTRFPKTYGYLKRFENILRQRASRGIKDMMQKGAPFYTMFAVGDYTFAPWKVVWTRMARIEAAVIGTLDKKPIIPQETITLVECGTKEEAHYIAALVNSTPFQFAAISYSQEGGKSMGSMHILENIFVPKFENKNFLHIKLAELSEMAHEAANAGDKKKIKEIEEEIDHVAAKIWGLTDKELKEIKESLDELQGQIGNGEDDKE